MTRHLPSFNSGKTGAGAATPLALVASASGPAMAEPWSLAGKQVYMIGIGGSGMSGMARMLMARGARVQGSDSTATDLTAALQRDGVMVDTDAPRQWLPEACDLVVASAAIKPEHPQMVEAARRGIAHMSYAQALGACMLGRTALCIAGTHGKSTTTSMLSCILSDAGLDPTAILGATCAQLSGSGANSSQGFRLGSATIPTGPMAGRPGLILAESCEFNRSFHNYHPTIGVITSVEADHLDIYGSLDAVVQSFRTFAERIAPAQDGGLLLIAHTGAHRREIASGLACNVETIGYHPDADWYVTYDAMTRRVTLHGPDKRPAAMWSMLMPGAHNAMNAATAAALAIRLGVGGPVIERALAAFRGVDRRSQRLGTFRQPHWPKDASVPVFDDYGHHPTEVETTLRAMRQFDRPEARGGRLICVFQPHQHSRTRHLMDEFVASFDQADVVLVPHIYFVRDSAEEKAKVTAGDRVERLRARGVDALLIEPFSAIVDLLRATLLPNDVLVVMGAGPV
ncbi:MAG: UDP-N-acetylmuramate--L-alanine ligase, partial [Phycisphaerales bacterium]|nr:UDP-N-acetylmuramate--L-alanine ligase [Phycisphaerales bacterium]